MEDPHLWALIKVKAYIFHLHLGMKVCNILVTFLKMLVMKTVYHTPDPVIYIN